MSPKAVDIEVVVGIDVSKDKVDVCILSGQQNNHFTYPSTAYDKMAKTIARHKPQVIILEPSGGYERIVIAELKLKSLPVVMVNPLKARNFAKAIGHTAKTDKIDAYVLARYGKDIKPEARPLPSPALSELKELMERRRQLMKMRVMESNRYQQAVSTKAKHSIKALLEQIQLQIDMLGRDMDTHMGSHQELKDKEAILTSVPGIGPHTARSLLSSMPELGTLSQGQAASLAGLAPHNRDSGKWRGKRMIGGGRFNARCALYMAAITASRYNHAIKAFYQRLKQQGKPFKVAITACMRKLIVIVNALLRENNTFGVKEIA